MSDLLATVPLSAIRVFEAAARLKSFTRAADELGMTQAAVSWQVKALEKRLDQPLFRRLPREVLGELFEFIGVDPHQAIDVTRRYNTTTEPRWPALHRRLRPLSPWAGAVLPAGILRRVRSWSRRRSTHRPSADERAMIAAAYEADIVALQELVGRDLSHWRLAATR